MKPGMESSPSFTPCRRGRLSRLRVVFVACVIFFVWAGTALADIEPIDQVPTDPTMATNFDNLMNTQSSPSSYNSRPSTFPFDAEDYSRSAKVRAGIWRARVAGRYAPRITKLGRWFLPEAGTLGPCAGSLNLAVCAVAFFDFGWTVGSSINQAFLGRWNGGFVCVVPWNCKNSSTGRKTTPTGDTNFGNNSFWYSASNNFSGGASCNAWNSSYSGSTCPGGVGAIYNEPLPCGGSDPGYAQIGCAGDPAGTTNVVLGAACEPGATMLGANCSGGWISAYDYDYCSAFQVISSGNLFQGVSGGRYICNGASQTEINDRYFFWGQMKADAQYGNCHLFIIAAATGGSAGAPPLYTCYLTDNEFEDQLGDMRPGTSSPPYSPEAPGSYTPPTPNPTDRAAAIAKLKRPGDGAARRAIDCYLDPLNSFCTDPTKTADPAGTGDPNGTPGVQNVYVINWPGTQTVTCSNCATGTGTSFTPFVLPKPALDETYSDYNERLRAAGWLGTLTIDATESGSTGLSGYGPNAITRIHVGPLGTDVDPAAWPLNAPTVDTPTTQIHIRVNPGTAGILGVPSCGPTVPSVDFAPLEAIDFGSKFPFGIFGYIASALSPLVASPTAPVFDVPIALMGDTWNLHVDLSPADPYMATIRLLMEIGIGIAAIYLLASSLLGFRAGNAGGGLEMGAELGDD